MNNTTPRPLLSFDGKGINGPDEYRTRLATFTPAALVSGDSEKWGRLMAAAPEMLAVLEDCRAMLRNTAECNLFDAVRAVIAKAKG